MLCWRPSESQRCCTGSDCLIDQITSVSTGIMYVSHWRPRDVTSNDFIGHTENIQSTTSAGVSAFCAANLHEKRGYFQTLFFSQRNDRKFRVSSNISHREIFLIDIRDATRWITNRVFLKEQVLFDIAPVTSS